MNPASCNQHVPLCGKRILPVQLQPQCSCSSIVLALQPVLQRLHCNTSDHLATSRLRWEVMMSTFLMQQQQMPQPVQGAAQEQQGRQGIAAGDRITAELPPWRQKRPLPSPTPPAARTSAAQRQPQPRPGAARQPPPAAAASAAARQHPAQRQWPGLPGPAAAAGRNGFAIRL